MKLRGIAVEQAAHAVGAVLVDHRPCGPRRSSRRRTCRWRRGRRESTPQRPLTPWTEMAPTGSSTPMRSQKKTLTTTSTPAIAPMRTAAQRIDEGAGRRDGHQAGEHAVAHHRRVGLHALDHHDRPCEARAPVTLASMVLTTTKLIRRSVPASVEPGLKPNQPKARMKVPSDDHGNVVARESPAACR